MTTRHLIIDTPYGTVGASVQDKGEDAVLYILGGALRGQVHVTGTHDFHAWDRFTALHACFGSCDSYAAQAPVESLPRLRNSSAHYTGSELRSTGDEPAYRSVQPLESTAGNKPTEKMARTLITVLHACADDVAERAGVARILDASRVRETPGLLRFLHSVITDLRVSATRWDREAAEHASSGRAATAAWWWAARWLAPSANPAVLLLLADRPGSLARLALVEPQMAGIYERAASEERQRCARYVAEVDSLRAQQRPRRPPARTARRTPA